jgi:hypothetical protein
MSDLNFIVQSPLDYVTSCTRDQFFIARKIVQFAENSRIRLRHSMR